MEKRRLDCHVVLDRSGSMADAWDETLKAVNGYVKEIAVDADIKTRVSVTVFDSRSVDLIRDSVKAKEFKAITADEVVPRATTPLFDAIGKAVQHMRDGGREAARKALVIMTDGLENASQEHTASSIKALIEKCREDGWLITYLGADHDAWDQAKHIGLSASHVANYNKGNEAHISPLNMCESARRDIKTQRAIRAWGGRCGIGFWRDGGPNYSRRSWFGPSTYWHYSRSCNLGFECC